MELKADIVIITSEASKKYKGDNTMINNLFSKNLRKLRISKNYTQEQVAEQLGVSAQSISRWECGNTFPDITLLPEIAELYCVTIDDLFKENTTAYHNYADRLLSVYEHSDKPEDFVRADLEFQKLLASNEYTADDLRRYGILHQYMMNYCINKSIALFDKAIKYSHQEDDDINYRTLQQKILLLSQIGRNQENIDSHSAALKANPSNPNHWLCLISAYHYAGEDENAYHYYKEALNKFPGSHQLYIIGGDICRSLKKYDEAFYCWNKSLDLDSSFSDAKYSKGFCYQELGQFDKAYDIWCNLTNELESKGHIIESEFPKQLANECKNKLSNK